jgi:hypothetical protein
MNKQVFQRKVTGILGKNKNPAQKLKESFRKHQWAPGYPCTL